MTGRDKIRDVVRTLRDDAESAEDASKQLIEEMLKNRQVADLLERVEADLTDDQCEQITSDWDFSGAN